jgi:hypothetical protein
MLKETFFCPRAKKYISFCYESINYETGTRKICKYHYQNIGCTYARPRLRKGKRASSDN